MKNKNKYEFEDDSPDYKNTLPHIIPIITSYKVNGETQKILGEVSDLYNWYYSLVKNVNRDEPSKELVNLVNKITSNKKNDLEKVKAIYYWTQKNIKYIAFEYALGGFIPRESNDVFRKKYGDCKDNSSILFKMLEIAGVKGNLTWIGTRSIPYTYKEVPTPLVDNHMILSYENKGKTYFLDATGRYIKFGVPTSFIQGKEALVSNGSKFKIKKVPVIQPKENAIIDTTFIKIIGNNILGNSKTAISGYPKIDYFHDLEDENSQTKLKEFYNKKLKKGNNKFLIKNFKEINKYSYDQDFIIDYTFEVDSYFKQLGDEIYINLNLNKELSKFKTDKKRKNEIEFDYKSYYSFYTVLEVPVNFKVDYLPENISVSNDLMNCNISYQLKENQIIYNQTIELNFLTLNLEEQKEVNAQIKKVEKKYKEIIVLKKKKPTMKNKHLLLVILLVSFQIVFSQELPFFKSYDWDNNPSYKIEKQSNEAMIALKEKIVTEFYFEDNSLVEYFLEHKILWLNSDDKIEDYNKVYLPYSLSSNLEVNKARVITKEGKVINLDESKILTASDKETGKEYKYFAFEGITKGSFIEYIYVVKKSPTYKGKKLNLQASYDKEVIEFDLFSPKNLIFNFKSYNNIPTVVKDTITKSKLHWKLHLNKLKKIEKENLSAYNASKGFVVYKLDKNTANKVTDISSYSKVSQNIYTFYYPKYKKKTIELINKFISELKLDGIKEEENIVRKLDFFIKTNVFTSDVANDDLQNLDQILIKKVMNETGALKLYVAILRALKIKHELVITSDRRQIKFDNKFEANNFLVDFLIYFPKTKLYLSPNDSDSRFGFPSAYNTDNYGLFIKEVEIGNFKSAIGKIKYIKPVKSDKTFDIMLITVDFNKDNLSENNIQLDRSFNGYYAMSIQPFIHLIEGDKKNELIDGLAESISKEIEVKNRKLVNGSPELFGIKPLQFIVDFTSEAFVEKAGRKYLFKLGELIGAQTQLYQEKERVLPLEEQFQRSYFRTITINIPEGYKVTNLKDINIDNSYSEKGKELFAFKSSFKLTGNILKITADEHYRKNLVDVSIYEKYRKVINSAADFNKIILLIEPSPK